MTLQTLFPPEIRCLDDVPRLQDVEEVILRAAMRLHTEDEVPLTRIAARLGISTKTLWEKRKRYEID